MSNLDQLLAAQASAPQSLGSPQDALDSMLASRATAPASAHPAPQPVAVSAGNAINDIPRQLGLTTRYGLEGLANAAQIITEPIRNALVGLEHSIPMLGDPGRQDPLMMTRRSGPPIVPTGQFASQVADSIGLPKPQGANERVVGDATRLLAGAGAMGGVARVAGAAPGLVGQAGKFLAANMPQQLSSAVGAGLFGGASREAGAGPVGQAGASFIGGVLGGSVPGAVNTTVNAVRNAVSKPNPQQLDSQIRVILNRSGVDFDSLPQAAQNSLRGDLQQALNIGQELDPRAVARLADFRSVGATPTRGMVTLDPVQITREQNLAKTGANSSDAVLQGLPRIQNQNNTTLIRSLNNAGASSGDLFRAGERSINAIDAADSAMQRDVSSLYQQARDSAGRSAMLDGAAFTRNANQALDQALLGGALPQSVATHMNRIATGQVPFNVDYAEQLKTAIGNLQRATNDGQTRMALGVVRRALDETPLAAAEQVNPGNLPAIAGTVPQSPQVLGRESIDAFNQARQAARSRFAWQESGRPIQAALNGAAPDKFVQRYVINGTLDDAQAIANNAPVQEVKNAILAHLKDKALNGASDEVGKFSQSAYNKALSAIGDRKLSLFFTPEEMGQLHSVGRVASYMQVQPVGSAVNNSNSGALLIGKGYDAIKGIAAKLPGGQSLLLNPLNNIEISVRNRQAQNVIPGLLVPQSRPPLGQGLLLPGAALGGLLAAPASP